VDGDGPHDIGAEADVEDGGEEEIGEPPVEDFLVAEVFSDFVLLFGVGGGGEEDDGVVGFEIFLVITFDFDFPGDEFNCGIRLVCFDEFKFSTGEVHTRVEDAFKLVELEFLNFDFFNICRVFFTFSANMLLEGLCIQTRLQDQWFVI